MINVKLNLTKLLHVRMTKKNKEGKEIEGIFMPIDANKLQRSTKEGYDNLYLDLVGFKLKEPRRNDAGNLTQTHLVKQSLPREEREAMSDEDKNAMPILGNIVNLEMEQPSDDSQPNSPTGGEAISEDDDLPF